MAEVLELGRSLAQAFEPKRAFRWIVEIEGIDTFLAESMSRPKFDVDETESRYINTVAYYAGRVTPQTLPLALKDAIAPSQTQKCTEWMRAVYEQETGRAGYKVMYSKTVTIKMLSPTLEVVEKWDLENAWPVNIDPSDLTYMDSDLARVTLTLRFDRALLRF